MEPERKTSHALSFKVYERTLVLNRNEEDINVIGLCLFCVQAVLSWVFYLKYFFSYLLPILECVYLQQRLFSPIFQHILPPFYLSIYYLCFMLYKKREQERRIAQIESIFSCHNDGSKSNRGERCGSITPNGCKGSKVRINS